MKMTLKLCASVLLLMGLSACETIDEERFANIACNDLKQLVATENLAALSTPDVIGLYRTSEDRENRDALNIFDLSDKDRKRQAELRAAYRNNCR